MCEKIIDIPGTKHFVLAGCIPSRIAEIMEPMPIKTYALGTLKKMVCIGENHCKTEDLTGPDFDYIHDIWRTHPSFSNNPNFIYGCTIQEYKVFENTFVSASNKPNWDLYAEFRNMKAEAENRRQNIIRDHTNMINSAIEAGTLKVLTARHSPASRLEHDSLLRVEDARSYLATIFFELCVKTHKTPEIILELCVEVQEPFEKHPPDIFDADEQPRVDQPWQLGVNRNEIMKYFRVKRDTEENDVWWDSILSDPPKWLLENHARMHKGRPGISAHWNPAVIACNLLENRERLINIHHLINIDQTPLEATIKANFPTWHNDWKKLTEYD